MSNVDIVLRGIAAEIQEYSLQGLVDCTGQRRGRILKLFPFPIATPTLWGFWFSMTNNVDYIVYEADTATIHQHHIILHELGHILLGHQTVVVDADTELTPQTFATLMGAAAARSDCYSNQPQELEAERMATALRNILVARAGFQALTFRVATLPMWKNLANELVLDR